MSTNTMSLNRAFGFLTKIAKENHTYSVTFWHERRRSPNVENTSTSSTNTRIVLPLGTMGIKLNGKRRNTVYRLMLNPGKVDEVTQRVTFAENVTRLFLRKASAATKESIKIALSAKSPICFIVKNKECVSAAHPDTGVSYCID